MAQLQLSKVLDQVKEQDGKQREAQVRPQQRSICEEQVKQRLFIVRCSNLDPRSASASRRGSLMLPGASSAHLVGVPQRAGYAP